MNLIVAIDDRNGLMFNKRRQSQDRVLREKVLAMTTGKKLWMNHYTQKQFADCDAAQINVDENYMNEAAPGDYCYLENTVASHYEKWIEKIILFKWNRAYPGDFYFDIDLSSPEWKLTRSEDFSGASHEKITMEVYCHEKK
jgi:hypothetical protein